MADPRALRNKRLENEHKELMRINGSIIQIVPVGSPPYETYRVTFNIRTIISPSPAYRNQTVCTLRNRTRIKCGAFYSNCLCNEGIT
jgi:hypothetical protein